MQEAHLMGGLLSHGSDAGLAMPLVGLEPTIPFGHCVLSAARIPIPSQRLVVGEDRRGVEPRDAVSDTDTLAKCLLYLWLTIQVTEHLATPDPLERRGDYGPRPCCQSFLAVKGRPEEPSTSMSFASSQEVFIVLPGTILRRHLGENGSDGACGEEAGEFTTVKQLHPVRAGIHVVCDDHLYNCLALHYTGDRVAYCFWIGTTSDCYIIHSSSSESAVTGNRTPVSTLATSRVCRSTITAWWREAA